MENTDEASMALLREYLSGLAPGPIEDFDTTLLAHCWDRLACSDNLGMTPDKLYTRMENIVWNPPVLSFDIERHGGLMMGSSSAEIQRWNVDVEQEIRRGSTGRFKQSTPRDAPLDVAPIVQKIVEAILREEDEPYLRWSDNRTKVAIGIGKLIPQNGPQQTVEGRRKRFRTSLAASLAEHNWTMDGSPLRFKKGEETST